MNNQKKLIPGLIGAILISVAGYGFAADEVKSQLKGELPRIHEEVRIAAKPLGDIGFLSDQELARAIAGGDREVDRCVNPGNTIAAALGDKKPIEVCVKSLYEEKVFDELSLVERGLVKAAEKARTIKGFLDK